MNILFVSPVVPSPWRGRRPYNLLVHLARAGHAIQLLALPYQAGSDEDLARLRELGIGTRLIPFSKAPALLRAAVALPGRRPLRVAYCDSALLRRAVEDALRHGRYDLVHLDRFRLSGLFDAPPPLPVVLDLPDALDLYYRRVLGTDHKVTRRAVARIEAPRITRWQAERLGHFSATLVCSSIDAAHLRQLAPGARIEVIENTADVDEFKPPERRSLSHVLFAGTLSYLPNVDGLRYFLDDIWPRICEKRPRTRLRLVGTRPGRTARELATRPGVELVGHVPSMAAEMRGGVLACPIRIASGTRIKLIEAMAAGMPAVSSTLGAEGLDVADGRELLLADDARRFAEGILRLLDDPALAVELSRRAREYAVARHSLAAVGARLEAVYHSLAR